MVEKRSLYRKERSPNPLGAFVESKVRRCIDRNVRLLFSATISFLDKSLMAYFRDLESLEPFRTRPLMKLL
jgi:hypothetical protein